MMRSKVLQSQTLIHIQQDKRFTFQNTDIRCIVHQISMMNIFPSIIVCSILRPQIGYRTKMHLLGFLVFKFFLQFSGKELLQRKRFLRKSKMYGQRS